MTPMTFPPVVGAVAVTLKASDWVSVYSAVAPVAYTDLDLSGTIGAVKTLVWLAAKNNSGDATALWLRVRQNGDAINQGLGAASALTSTVFGDQDLAYIVTETDENGIVEHVWSAAKNVDIWIMGYIQ